jgi:hypothetical protein
LVGVRHTGGGGGGGGGADKKRPQGSSQGSGNGGPKGSNGEGETPAAARARANTGGDHTDRKKDDKKDDIEMLDGKAAGKGGEARAARIKKIEVLSGPKLQSAMLTGLLMSLQTNREMKGVLYQVWMVATDSKEAEGIKEEGLKYSIACRETGKGHKLGPPSIHRAGGLFRALASRGNSIGAKSAADLQELIKKYDELDTQDSVLFVPHCKTTKAYDKSQTKIELMVACMESRKLISACMEQAGARTLLGQAPPGGLEDSLQRTLDDLRKRH